MGFAHLAAPSESPSVVGLSPPAPFLPWQIFPPKSSVDINKQTTRGITEELGEGARSWLPAGGGPCAFVLNNEPAVIENI